MNIKLNTHIITRQFSNDIIRKSRSFTPDGFSEKIWILFEGSNSGIELFDEICEQIFEYIFESHDTNYESPISKFEQSMRALNKKIQKKDILKDDFLSNNSFVIILSYQNEIHLTTLGNSEVYFIRNDKVMHISEGIAAQNIKDDLFLNVASGEIQNKDVLIFSTIPLLTHMTHSQMADISKNNDEKEILVTIEEFIDLAEGGVIGASVVSGSLALPFDDVNTPISYNKKDNNKVETISDKMQKSIKHYSSRIPFLKEVLFLLATIITLFAVWTGIGMISNEINSDTEKYKIILKDVSNNIGIAYSMANDGRKDESIRLLNKTEIKAKDLFQNSTFQSDAQRFLRQITEMKDNLSNTTRISGKSLIDISNQNDLLKGLFFFDEELYTFGENNLFRIIDNKVENIIPFNEDEKIIKGIPLEKKQKMVFLTESGNVIESEKLKSDYAKTKDIASWKKGNDISFFDKNIYILSPDNNEIYKYSRGSELYSSPLSYNKSTDLKNAISITIDGSIYILKENGIVTKLFRGTEQNFLLKDKPEGFDSVTSIYTKPDLDLLLFLSPSTNRIYIFQKNDNEAIFEQQYIIDGENEQLSGLWFDLNYNRILVSGKQKIYEIPLTK
jgi:WD40 repeat protein